MPANAIRRSDDKVTERYEKFAEKLEKFQEHLDVPKFYEHGKSVTYQEGDVACLPTFTTNNIRLSDINGTSSQRTMKKTASVQEDDKLTERAARRRIIAQIDLDLDVPLQEKRCPKCDGARIRDLSEGQSIMPINGCEECGHKWRGEGEQEAVEDNIMFGGPEENIFETPDKEVRHIRLELPKHDETEVLASIQSMLPQVTAKLNGSMNKMAQNITQGLINSLNIDDSSKNWLNAQIENGVINADVFMRNIKTSLQTGGAK